MNVGKFSPLKFIPHIGATLIFLGFLRLHIYYSSFGINIINFLEFSEIITTFLDLTIIIVLVVIGMIFQTIFLSSPGKIHGRLEANYLTIWNMNWQESKDKGRVPKILDVFRIYIDSYKHCMKTGIVLLVVLILFGFLKGNHISGVYVIIIFFCLSTYTIAFIKGTFLKERDYLLNDCKPSGRKSVQLFQLLMYGAVLLLIVTIQSFHEVYQVRNNSKMSDVSFQTTNNNNLIVSDTNRYYIGNTTKYLFLYHEAGDSTEVIPIENVRNLTFPNKNRCVYDFIKGSF